MRLILRSKQWNYTQNIKKNNKIRFFIFFIPNIMKPQKWKNIKNLPEKSTKKEAQEKISPSPLELWLRQIDKNVEFLYDEINQRELSNTETEQKIGDLKRRINRLSIQIDCLIWRSWKIGEELQELERGKSRIVIFAIICLWLFLLDRASKSTTEETFIFQFVVGIGLITVAVYEAMRD